MKRMLFICCAAVAAAALFPPGAAAVSVGDEAPAFTAVSDKGRLSLSDYRGEKNVILAFYFAINTPA